MRRVELFSDRGIPHFAVLDERGRCALRMRDSKGRWTACNRSADHELHFDPGDCYWEG